MRICLLTPNETLLGLRSRLELGGHVVEIREGGYFDVTLKESEELPKSVVASLGFEVSTSPVKYAVSRFYNGTWGSEVLLHLPIQKLLSGGLGPEVVGGCVTCRQHSQLLAAYFVNPLLEEFLKLSGHKGFFTIGMNDLEPVSLHLGIPFYGFYNFMQMSGGSLVERISERPSHLPDKWQVSLLLARFPYPKERVGRKIWVEVGEKATEHFWPWAEGKDFNGRSFQTTRNVIGIATAYGSSLVEALGFAEITCSSIEVSEKMYFRKGYEEVLDLWDDVQAALRSGEPSDHVEPVVS